MKFDIDNKEFYITEIFINDVEIEELIYGQNNIIFPINCFSIEIEDIDFNIRVFLVSQDYNFQGMLIFKDPEIRPYSIHLVEIDSNFSKAKGIRRIDIVDEKMISSWLLGKHFSEIKKKLKNYLLA